MGRFGIGQPVRRVEDQRFLTGQGRYGDDIRLENPCHVAFVRSPHACAEVIDIDTSTARVMPDVVAVYTGADLAGAGVAPIGIRSQLTNIDGTDLAPPPRYVLARGRVRHVGDPVAAIVAETRAAAVAAAEAVVVDYREDVPVVAVADAAAHGASLVHDERPGNVVFDWQIGDGEAAEAEFSKASHRVTCDLINNRIVPNSMEPRIAVAIPDDGGVTLTGSIQNVFVYRDLVSAALGWDRERVRVYADDIGGGFGCKNQVQPEHILSVYAADDLGRPVKWVASRSEAFVTDAHARGLETRVELALDEDYRFTALGVRTRADIGAYCSTNGPLIPCMATAAVLGGAYDLQSVHMHVTGYFTHTPPTDAYRGAGRPEATYLLERTIDKAAAELDLDPVELRRRNLVRPDQIPYETALGKTLDCGDFPAVLEEGIATADRPGYAARKRDSEAKGLLRGLGIGAYMESTLGVPSEFARVGIAKDGAAEIVVGTQNAGMGHETSFRQLVAEILDIPLEAISYKHADTGAMPQGGGHGGSRSIQIGGSAVHFAAGKVLERLKHHAGDLLEADALDIEYGDCLFRVTGTDSTATLEMVLQAMPEDVREAHIYKRENFSFPNGVHVCEVELDPETGRIAIDRYTVCDDFGRIINPMIVLGQVMGGIAQGLGQAVLEHTAFDAQSGQMLSGSLMDYALPRADSFPEPRISFFEDAPAISNPLGVKGCGEAGTIASLPAVVNAVVDALHPYGVTHVDMPLLPEKLWRIIAEAQQAPDN